ncbi:MAG: RnfABCDGE type electron transport complex subunit G [Oscillospiraceae bacterium]|nr:RnfABCDGE type electron transport complex subunit G [Oscillospiraceae bacterium]
MTDTKKKPESPARLTLILFAITLVTSLLLGLVNFITKDRIAEINLEKTASAMREVLSADEYVPVEYAGSNNTVTGANRAVRGGNSVGYVMEVAPSGFGGLIKMVVGVDPDGKITGVSIVNMSETSGLGTGANDEGFRRQYIGGAGGFAVDKDGGKIDSLTGATITSRAVTAGVNAAAEAAETLGQEAR